MAEASCSRWSLTLDIAKNGSEVWPEYGLANGLDVLAFTILITVENVVGVLCRLYGFFHATNDPSAPWDIVAIV